MNQFQEGLVLIKGIQFVFISLNNTPTYFKIKPCYTFFPATLFSRY